MDDEPVKEIAQLLHQRNAIDDRIAAVTNRPMAAGHLGEWIAARVFGIELEPSAVAAAIDGRFTQAPLAGRSVNVKWYLKREGLLDLTETGMPDYYLVMTGPAAVATSSRGATRPWCIESVYLFDATGLTEELRSRAVKIGVGTSVTAKQWMAAEVFPQTRNSLLAVSTEQADLLRPFAPAAHR